MHGAIEYSLLLWMEKDYASTHPRWEDLKGKHGDENGTKTQAGKHTDRFHLRHPPSFLPDCSRIARLLERMVRLAWEEQAQRCNLAEGPCCKCPGGDTSICPCIVESTCKCRDLNNQTAPYQASLMGLETVWPKVPWAFQPHTQGLSLREKSRSPKSVYWVWKVSQLAT